MKPSRSWRKLRSAGAIVNKKCGIHVHIDASPLMGTLRNITNIMASKEDLIYKTLQVDVHGNDSTVER